MTPENPAGLREALLAAAQAAHLWSPDHQRVPFEDCSYEPCRRARSALAAAEPGLDVERLARAMDLVVPESIPPLYWTNERLARAIAAEYARLTGKETGR